MTQLIHKVNVRYVYTNVNFPAKKFCLHLKETSDFWLGKTFLLPSGPSFPTILFPLRKYLKLSYKNQNCLVEWRIKSGYYRMSCLWLTASTNILKQNDVTMSWWSRWYAKTGTKPIGLTMLLIHSSLQWQNTEEEIPDAIPPFPLIILIFWFFTFYFS